MKKVFSALLFAGVIGTYAQPSQLLPLQKGMTVVTNRTGVQIVDTRTITNNASHFVMLSPPEQMKPNWVTSADKVFGVTIDQDPQPNIYVTSTSCYIGFGTATGNVYKLDGQTGNPSVLVTLPNSGVGPGLGNICYDNAHPSLFVTNMEDGKIYRISVTGTILSTYDPFAPDNGAAGFAPQGEKLWGVAIYNGKLFFSRWNTDMGQVSGNHNEIYSISIDPNTGNLTGTPTLEITLPYLTGGLGFSSPVSSITFSSGGNMLLAERTMKGDNGHCWNYARVLEYQQSGNNWTPSPNKFLTNTQPYAATCFTGTPPVGTLCEGGAGYNDNQNVIATGSYLISGYSGLTIMPIGGNNLPNPDQVNFYSSTLSGDFPGCLYVDNNTTISCPDCIGSFAPVPGMRYVLSAWMKDANAPANASGYTNPQIQVEFTVGPGGSGGTVSLAPFGAAGQVIDGWQRLEQEFFVPTNAFMLRLKLICGSGSNSQPCLFDDIRVFPFDGSMKSYVYDPETLRLVAELDERNYATMYEYDEEGKLTRVKKETERGVMTVKESKNSTHKK